MNKVSIIIPVIRPESAKRCIKAIKENAGIGIDRYEIISGIDSERVGCPIMLANLLKNAKYDLIMFLGDDTVPQQDFLKNALKAMDKIEWGVVGLNTEGPHPISKIIDEVPENSNPIAHWLAHRKILEHIEGGNFFSTEYKHCFGDNEIYDVADELDRWIFAEDSIIEHRHPVNKSAEWDSDYDNAYKQEKWNHDFNMYRRRRVDRLRRNGKRKLAVAIPLTDIYNFAQFTVSYAILEKPKEFEFIWPTFPGQIDVIRNDLVEQAFNLKCTDIIMLDTDQVYFSRDTITKLYEHDLPVIGARVHRRYPPFDPLCLEGEFDNLRVIADEKIEYSMKTGEPLQVIATGTGCIMYDLRVFTKIDKPWFKLDVNEKGEPIGEDIGCCEKLGKAGIPIYVDCSLDVKHLFLMAADWGFYKLWKRLQEVNLKRSERKKEMEYDGK